MANDMEMLNWLIVSSKTHGANFNLLIIKAHDTKIILVVGRAKYGFILYAKILLAFDKLYLMKQPLSLVSKKR